jgi:hypothetical protein
MIETRVDIGKTGRQMVIKKDDDGKLISVTDDLGNEAKSGKVGEVKLACEVGDKFRAPMTSAKDDTFILTKHNPTCGWYYYNRHWYWICY